MIKFREEAGFTQRQAALAIGGQKTPKLSPIQTWQLCQILNYQLEDLMKGKDNN